MDNNVWQKKRETMEEPYMILRGIRHRIKMISLCDVHWLLVCVDEFSMMELKT
jgi:hypothetical protein